MKPHIFLIGLSFLSFGHLIAADPAGQLAQMKAQIEKTIEANHHQEIYRSYLDYVGKQLDSCAGEKRVRDRNGLFRLSTVDRWLRNPLVAPGEAEALTRSLHADAADPARLTAFLTRCVKLLDLPPPAAGERKKFASPEDALKELQSRLSAARAANSEALKKLKPKDLETLMAQSDKLLIPTAVDGPAHALPETERGEAKAMLDLLRQVDLKPMIQGAVSILELLEDRDFMVLLSNLPPKRYGTVLVGSPGDDTYNLDELKDVDCVIDPGGNDTYLEGSTSPSRPVLLIIDFKGNDHYVAKKPFAQGCGHFGVSILWDAEGDDRYEALHASQGCATAGIGLLIDGAGNDTYTGDARVQGSAFYGIGALIDRSGNDSYTAALYAQGCGGGFGVGVIEDSAGNDHYVAGGKYEDGYQEPPHFYREAWSQGCGAGPRGSCNGGIGILLDGGGDDVYEADYFSTGGYWFAAGLNRDFGGNDIRKPLSKNFSRYGLGYGCHFGIGMLFDDAGDDQYLGGLGVQGFGWDLALGGVFDFAGNDAYTTTASGQGFACEFSWAILFDANGSDKYLGVAANGTNGQGAAGKVSYHPSLGGAGNFSFLVDLGEGQDEISCGAKLDATTPRGADGGVGYVIHHPQ
jgi:hypothetical protein